MKMNHPFFSVIIPVYNVAQTFFEECISSILNQTMGSFELILVDDGSRAECAAQCDAFAEKDARIRVIHQENQGVSVARNNGILAACADWIVFVDADDWLELDSLERLYSRLDSKYDILMFRCIRETETMSKVMDYGIETDRLYDLTQFESKEFFYRKVMRVPNAQKQRTEPMYYSCDKVYRRAFLMENEIRYPVGLAKSEDKVFITRCLEKMHYFYHVDDALYHYRMNDASVCHRYSANMDEQRLMLAKMLVPMANNMDAELGEMSGDASYHHVSDDNMRFIFGLLTDVLYLKYYHNDNPDKKTRRREALRFMHTSPFRESIKEVPYRGMSSRSKIKKFLLSLNMVTTFCLLSRKYRKM
ncbi:MAG: glycosyltransferase [Ruminococcus sp.]|nr:glycosyltransferase [Ruminococcus sp.]